MASRLSRLRSRKASAQPRTGTGRFTSATRTRSSVTTTAGRGTTRAARTGLTLGLGVRDVLAAHADEAGESD